MYLAPNNGLISASTRDLAPFQLLRPETVDEAVAALAEGDTPPVIYAGGTDIVGQVREGRQFKRLLWLKDLDQLKTIEVKNNALHIGALTALDDAANNPALDSISGLGAAINALANVRIRFTATVGGNVMARHTAYEMLPILMALEGRMNFRAASGDFNVAPKDIWDHDGLDRALLTEIIIPLDGAPRLDYDRTLRPYMTHAVAQRGSNARAAVATRVLRPHGFEFASNASAADVYTALPDNYADELLANDYLRTTGAKLLERQMMRLAGAD